MSSKKTDTRFWDGRRNIIRTRKGGWRIGQGVKSHGYDLLRDLVGRKSFFQVLILNISGFLPEKRLADWIESAFICLSWPDPRIWCNQIGSLGGTLQSTPPAGICSGTLASDSSLYGPGTTLEAVHFIKDALSKKKSGVSPSEFIRKLAKHRLTPPGYARPIASGDERVAAMEEVTAMLGFEIGEHLRLAYEIQQILMELSGESLNLAGYMAAFLSDQGFTAEECYRICSLCVHAGVAACYAEAYDFPPESFLPLRCDDIDYQGKPPRSLKKAKDSKSS